MRAFFIKNKVINKNSENLNQTRLMFWARVRKRAPSWEKGGTSIKISVFILILLQEIELQQLWGLFIIVKMDIM